MKYVRNFESFKEQEKLNEEILGLGKLFNFLGGKIKNWYKSVQATKGGKEVDAIYNKYLEIINKELATKSGLDISLKSDQKLQEMEKEKQAAGSKPGEAAKPGEPAKPEQKPVEERYSMYKSYSKVFEAEEAQDDAANKNLKTDAAALKSKSAFIDQIIDKYVLLAKGEMMKILTKYGGPTGNPQLKGIIDAKIIQFDIALLRAKSDYAEKSGDKTLVAKATKELQAKTQEVDKIYKSITSLKAVEFKAGDKVIYLLKGKNLGNWDKLTDEEKANPEEGKAKEIVGVKKIVKTDGKIFTFKTNDGKEFTKTRAELIDKAPGAQEDVELKVGDKVFWTNKEGKEIEREIVDIKDDELTFKNDKGETYTKNKVDVEKRQKDE